MKALENLTPKQRDFVLSYIKCKNATQAAKEAGYSDKTAYSQGQRLLKNVEIQKAFQGYMEPIMKKHEITVENIVGELAEIGFADWQKFITVGERAVDLKLNEKIKALQLLGDHAGAWKPKQLELLGLSQVLDHADGATKQDGGEDQDV